MNIQEYIIDYNQITGSLHALKPVSCSTKMQQMHAVQPSCHQWALPAAEVWNAWNKSIIFIAIFVYVCNLAVLQIVNLSQN